MIAVLVLVMVVVLVVLGLTGYVVSSRRRSRLQAPPVLEVAEEAAPAEKAPPDLEVAEEAAPAEKAPPVLEVAEEAAPAEKAPPDLEVAEEAAPPRIRERLGKARSLLAGYLGSVASRGKLDEETWESLEEALLRADVGVATSRAILESLRVQAKEEKIRSADDLLAALGRQMLAVFDGKDRRLRSEEGSTSLWLFVGVNGVGKTTTIGKLAQRITRGGKSVVMAAGDTFRAAAGEQLEQWAKRTGADIVRGAEGGDPGAVVFDAVQRAVARKADLVLADTAGRLHTKVNLMEELKKVRRVAERSPAQVTEVLLVIDATTGQNGLAQARQFAEAVGVTGVVLTKLDGTAKGGIALAIERDLGVPIKLVGIGEGAGDLVDFDPSEFVEGILGNG